MTLFFNLETLQAQCNNDPNKFMALLEYHYSKRLPKKRSLYKPSRVSLAGNNFLLNPKDLFLDKITDVLYKLQYVKLAARRDYNLYKFYQYKALQLSYFPDVKYDLIKQNPLLNITPHEIFFKYEEN
jgi:hypothetical protein